MSVPVLAKSGGATGSSSDGAGHAAALAWCSARWAVFPFPSSTIRTRRSKRSSSRRLEPRYVAPTRRDRIGRIWAPVYINGQGPFRLVLDTGSSHAAVNASVAATLGIPLTGLRTR